MAALVVTSAVVVACSADRVSGVGESSFASDLATVECISVFSCECDDYPYPDEAFCRDSVAGIYDALLEPGRKAGLSFDAECAQGFVDEYGEGEGECGSVLVDTGESDTTACSYCSLYNGDKALGEDCTQYSDFDDCGSGMLCEEGKCFDPCAVVLAGESCEDQGWGRDCEPGYHCSPEAEPVCTKTPATGEACQYYCADGSYCNFDEVCAVLPKLGEACDSGQCDEGLACSSAAICVQPPGPDEECASGECSTNAFCDHGDFDTAEPAICRARKAVGEECDGFDQCETGYCDETCVEEQAWVCE